MDSRSCTISSSSSYCCQRGGAAGYLLLPCRLSERRAAYYTTYRLANVPRGPALYITHCRTLIHVE